ncbi:unnamed protein product [Spirodela intermedia]|uniref:Uncharacterized protein n=1 Tax=Spirodela intermedia TaxID=51605 RepID=A0A7I8JV94_SPIIN|nr:unnamed protein product [Spirodela intermedia]CAA6673661.1 unnamed protein product [Spirodela intermedia]
MAGGTRPSIPEVTAAALSCTLFLFSLAAISFILHFHLRASRGEGPRPRRRLRDLNSLWAVRILLAVFACLWSMAELLRLRFLLPNWLHLDLCRGHVLASQGFAEPCFFTTLLFLLRTSVQGKICYPNAFAMALVLGTTNFSHGGRCSYPLFSTALLAWFGAAYVPWFVSACWRAAEVVINKRLGVRLYALTSTVVLGICVQVVALALSAFWSPGTAVFQGLRLAAFLGVFSSALVGEWVLVLCPIADALDAVGWRAPVPAAGHPPQQVPTLVAPPAALKTPDGREAAMMLRPVVCSSRPFFFNYSLECSTRKLCKRTSGSFNCFVYIKR